MPGAHAVDLNYLLHRHQISLMRASESDACEVRNVHLRFVDAYANRIEELATTVDADTSALARI